MREKDKKNNDQWPKNQSKSFSQASESKVKVINKQADKKSRQNMKSDLNEKNSLMISQMSSNMSIEEA